MIDVKVGDTVVISRHGVDESIQTVTRVLKRYFLTDKSDNKWSLNWGRQVGSSARDPPRARVVTKDEAANVRAEFKRRKLASRIEDTKFRELTLVQLEAIDAILKGGAK